MAVEHVEEDEKVKPAGISKQLTVQDKPWAFTERRTGDVEIVDLLEDLANSTMVPEPERMFVPSFYLVTRQRKHTVQVRDTPEALRYLQERDGYDSRLTPSENTQKSGKRIAQVLPKGRLAWPYQYFCAAGVAVSDLVVSGWLKGRKENCSVNEPTWRIDIFSEEQHGKEPDIS